MKQYSILIIICSSLLFFSCHKKNLKPDSFLEILETSIDSTFSFDKMLNDGDTLFLEFSNEIHLNKSEANELLKFCQYKYKMNVGLSSMEYLTKVDPAWKTEGYLKNFIISVKNFEYIKSNKIEVTTIKHKSKFGAIVVLTIFENLKDKWKCISSKIILIS